MNRKIKKQHLFEILFFCNIINVFTGTLDQVNASLMNKKYSFIYLFNLFYLAPQLIMIMRCLVVSVVCVCVCVCVSV